MIDDFLYRQPFVEFLRNLWRVKHLAVQFPKVALIVRTANIAWIRIICRESMSHNDGIALVFFKTGTIEMP